MSRDTLAFAMAFAALRMHNITFVVVEEYDHE